MSVEQFAELCLLLGTALKEWKALQPVTACYSVSLVSSAPLITGLAQLF
jgi:hypothetical protein